MRPTRRSRAGYSLIELLVVLSIVGVIMLVGVSAIGNRGANSVRSLMDQIEGTLVNTQSTALLTSRDVYVATVGHWTDASLILDGRALIAAPTSFNAGDDTNRVGSSSECFRSLYPRGQDHQYAGVDCADGWYAQALGNAPDLKTVDPVKSTPALLDAMSTPLFKGTNNYLILNGQTRRFETGFYIAVVSLSNGVPTVGGAVGVILVPKNSGNVYKFYKPSGSSIWRRL